MATAPDYDPNPLSGPRLSSDERRIAQAVVNALSPTLKRIEDKVDSNGKRIGVLEQQMRGVFQIFADNGFIMPDHD